MISMAAANAAKDVVGMVLRRLLGPKLAGLNAFGVSFDIAARDLVVRVDLDPGVYDEVRAEIPELIDNVPVRVESAEPAEFD